MIVKKLVAYCLILFSLFTIFPGIAFAEIAKKVDDFDDLTRIISISRGTAISELIFQKAYKKVKPAEYVLVLHEKRLSTVAISSLLSDTCIRFNGDKNDSYRLKQNAILDKHGQENIVSYQLSATIIDKILTCKSIEIKTYGRVVNFLVDHEKIIQLSPEIIKEWRQVIAQ